MKKRFLYLDLLRILAVIAVIIIHVTAEFWYIRPNDTLSWQINNIFNSLSAWGVPVFIMISGALLLPKEKKIEIKDIWFKYIPRMVLILFFWGVFYSLYEQGSLTLSSLIVAFKYVIAGNAYSHLWYLYMLIGLYVMLPILKIITRSASKIELEYMLIVGILLISLVPMVLQVKQIALLKNTMSMLHMDIFGEFVIYFIMGYYLDKYRISKTNCNHLYIATIVTVIFTVISTIYFTYNAIEFSVASGITSLASILMAVSIFLLAQNFETKISENVNVAKKITTSASLVFGIYLIHFLVEKELLKLGVHSEMFNAFISVPVVTITIFVISYVLVWILYKVPIIRKILS